jgi:UDP-glucose 4-epimerase
MSRWLVTGCASLKDVIKLSECLTGRRLEVEHQAAAAGGVRQTAADTALIRRDLTWPTETSFQAGLAGQFGWAAETTEEALGRGQSGMPT